MRAARLAYMVATLHSQRGHGDDVTAVPDTLAMLRERRGLTLTQIAAHFGRQTPWAHKIENGNLSLTGDLLSDYAALLGVPVALLGEDIPLADAGALHFRTLKLSKKVEKQAKAEINFRSFLVTRLLRAAGQPEGLDLPQIDVRTLAEGPAAAARHLRERWVVEGPLAELIPLAEQAGMFFTTMPADLSKVRGVTVHHSPDASPHTLVSRGASDDSGRVTIAHEIGHLVMDASSGEVDDLTCEARADQFAAELLAPYSALRDDLRKVRVGDARPLFELQAVWGVHPKALVEAAYRNGDMAASTRTHFYKLFNSRYRTALALLPPPYPLEFRATADLLSFMRTVGWSENLISRLTNVSPQELQSVLDGWTDAFDATARRPVASVTPLVASVRDQVAGAL